MKDKSFDWEKYVDDCDPKRFKSYVRAVKTVWQMTKKPPVGCEPPSPKAKEWLDEFLENVNPKIQLGWPDSVLYTAKSTKICKDCKKEFFYFQGMNIGLGNNPFFYCRDCMTKIKDEQKKKDVGAFLK